MKKRLVALVLLSLTSLGVIAAAESIPHTGFTQKAGACGTDGIPCPNP